MFLKGNNRPFSNRPPLAGELCGKTGAPQQTVRRHALSRFASRGNIATGKSSTTDMDGMTFLMPIRNLRFFGIHRLAFREQYRP